MKSLEGGEGGGNDVLRYRRSLEQEKDLFCLLMGFG